MIIKKKRLVLTLLAVAATGIGWLTTGVPPVLNETAVSENFGDITIAEPLWGSRATVVVFSDSKKFPALALVKRLAGVGVTAVIADPFEFLKTFNAETDQCLDAQHLAAAIDALLKLEPSFTAQRLVITGIGAGALLPFINAQPNLQNGAENLSIGFSINLPNELLLCPPYQSQGRNQNHILAAAPAIEGNWLAVWTDQPEQQTSLFIKSLGAIKTKIAAYDTPLDKVLLDEIQNLLNQDKDVLPMPVVDTPAKQPGDSLTIFYSGDGGWRDLDRTIANEMASQNYPVAGVDVLRYFWERKSAEQAAADLSALMNHYRKNKGIKSFVLAGYSFGADILPAIYNRLPQQDKDSVSLLALLALASHADFEIHVSGWLGQSGDESPLTPELAQIPKNKLLCIYGKEEKAETACTSLQNSQASILELPGGHHFDQDYPKLTRLILDVYRQHGINAEPSGVN